MTRVTIALGTRKKEAMLALKPLPEICALNLNQSQLDLLVIIAASAKLFSTKVSIKKLHSL